MTTYNASLFTKKIIISLAKPQNVIITNLGILEQIVVMKSKKINSAILAGFPCSHRKYIWFYNSGVSSLQISIIASSTEKIAISSTLLTQLLLVRCDFL